MFSTNVNILVLLYIRPRLLLRLDLLPLGPVSPKFRKLFGPGKLFYVGHICIHDQRFNNSENDTMKLSVNEKN